MAVYDFRMYTLKPGTTPDYMAAVRELALPIRQKYGVRLAGWYYSDVGELNQVVHIWWFQDYAHMEDAKAKVAADADWTQKYLPRVRGLIVAQKTYLMLSPDFAPEPQ
jgi:NIPSNAP